MAEFGGSLVDDSVEAEAVGDEIELEESQSRPQSTERTPRNGESCSYVNGID